MPITTSPSVSYVARSALMVVILIGFGLWGAYDLWVKIPHREQVADRFDQLTHRLSELATSAQQRQLHGQQPTPTEIDEYTKANEELKVIAPAGKPPVRPGKFDRLVQWIYIVCLPCALPTIFSLRRVLRQRYQLDEAGALHFQGDSDHGAGVWSATEIADIDMQRWMLKSIAWPVKGDGARLKLDAYLHRNLDLIIGAIAARLHPGQWHADAKPVKSDAGDGPTDGAMLDESVESTSENLARSDSPLANP